MVRTAPSASVVRAATRAQLPPATWRTSSTGAPASGAPPSSRRVPVKATGSPSSTLPLVGELSTSEVGRGALTSAEARDPAHAPVAPTTSSYRALPGTGAVTRTTPARSVVPAETTVAVPSAVRRSSW